MLSKLPQCPLGRSILHLPQSFTTWDLPSSCYLVSVGLVSTAPPSPNPPLDIGRFALHFGLELGVLLCRHLCLGELHMPGVGSLAVAGFGPVQNIPEPSVLQLRISNRYSKMVFWDSPNHELLVLPFHIHHTLSANERFPNSLLLCLGALVGQPSSGYRFGSRSGHSGAGSG